MVVLVKSLMMFPMQFSAYFRTLTITITSVILMPTTALSITYPYHPTPIKPHFLHNVALEKVRVTSHRRAWPFAGGQDMFRRHGKPSPFSCPTPQHVTYCPRNLLLPLSMIVFF